MCFESVALNVGAGVCGVLLTGANGDGAKGLKAIKDAGGLTIVQDPATADSTAMPRAALAIMQPDFIGSIESIARELSHYNARDF
jgi:two-component system chemotaxis response regulator CheB